MTWMTNAQYNRTQAIKCANAGMTAEQIAKAWPLVWKFDKRTGKIGQRYKPALTLPDGRLETDTMMARVDEIIAEHA